MRSEAKYVETLLSKQYVSVYFVNDVAEGPSQYRCVVRLKAYIKLLNIAQFKYEVQLLSLALFDSALF